MRRDRPTLLLVVVALAPTTGCNRQPSAGNGPAPAGPQVTVVRPEVRPVHWVIEQPGTIQAFEETALFAKLPAFVGKIAEDPDKLERIKENTDMKEWPEHDRYIDRGSRVKKDQVLVELRIPELEKELVEKKALVKKAEAEVVQAEKAEAAATAGVASAKAAVTEAEAGIDRAQALYERWQREVARVEKQVKSGVDTGQALDETQLGLKAAEAGRKEANAKVVSARAAVRKAEADEAKAAADVTAARERLEVAKADVGRVEALLGYTKITAPYDGVVTRRSVNTEDFVGSDKAALFSVARTDPVRVVVQVPEADAGLVAPGQDVTFAVQGLEGPPPVGKVRRTSWSLEPGSRTLWTEIDLPNPKGAFRPGMYVYARLTAELPPAWAVPAAAVAKIGDESVMYLVENSKAVRVAVQPLRGDGKFTQLKGFKKPGASDWTAITGNESVATPAAAVTDGQPVP
ncbi:MAG TPA: efflux RND transporter periplasmic adaptor subunit [Gemmataceae bacterium]|nr:efflux RND transporter periplasmic adaptor subunit [Gemmataceae bacterium]